jgi:hypothetical protein
MRFVVVNGIKRDDRKFLTAFESEIENYFQ